ncbi:endonuclease/exonuclease/phosphatase family protein [Microbacterium sp. C7(2022)]|uniref:endonuclease/exonuclease/phosphatase family protein n=1 Tax=Microbacterium sp. C7(2022) TaxID=2992759 RepID=UPI00237B3A47|nr:endonuclease/exonuclease/phosphatase family protein [Microbacterium sp. C7(2022)]MDE0545212.1 endonuclease/exonuclease/phosphatase family protein [Microbacterium sp. C7(2022)]
MNLEHFSVATFNLYNFQLPGLHMNPGQRHWTPEEFDRKVEWIGRQIRALDADVIGLQELWHADAMEAVMDAAGLRDDYELLATPAGGGRIICAALVRTGLRVGDPEWIEHFPDALRLQSNTPMDLQSPGIHVSIDRFARPVLRFRIALRDDHPHTEVFVAHLKSKLPIRIDTEPWFEDEPDVYKPHATAIGAALATIQRTAEATALRVLLTTLMKGTVTPVIVLGDINDGQHSNTVNILTEQPRYLVGDSRGGADIGLYTAQTLQEYRDTRDVYYTHVHEDLRESLDHVLVSEQFYDNSRRRLWLFDGLRINNDHLDAADHRADGSGDHGIVTVRFRYRPFR